MNDPSISLFELPESTITQIICPNCLKPPFIKLTEKNQNKIDLSCPFCKLSSTFSISEYTNILSEYSNKVKKCQIRPDHKNNFANTYCQQCKAWICLDCQISHESCAKEHILIKKYLTNYDLLCQTHNKLFKSYCYDCNLHICSDASCAYPSTHSETHKVKNIEINNYSTKEFINTVLLQIQNGMDYIDGYILKLKNKLIKKLNDKLNKVYGEFKRRNVELLDFIKTLNKSYNIEFPNCINRDNLEYNSTLKFKKFSLNIDNDNYDILYVAGKFIDFLNNNYLYNDINCEFSICNYKVKDEFKYYIPNINKLMVLSNGNFLSILSNKTIELYDSIKMKHIKSIKGNVSSICEINDGKIIFSDIDERKYIYMTDINLSFKKSIIETDFSNITCMIPFNHNNMFICSNYKRMFVYQKVNPVIDNYLLDQTIDAHETGIYSLVKIDSKNSIVSWGFDDTLKLWNFDKKITCFKVLREIKSTLGRGLAQIKNKLILGGRSLVIIINLEKFNIERYIHFCYDIDVFNCCALNQEVAICGCSKGKLFQINIEENEGYFSPVKILESSILHLVHIKDNFFLMGGKDKIKLMDY